MNCEELIEKAIGTDSEGLSFEQKMLIKKISKMDDLPIPNAHAMKAMLLLRSENVRMDELVDQIEKEQSLVARILKLVNSGFYGLRKSVDSIELAVGLLGIINIKHVIYSATIMDFFSEDEQQEWNHSYSTSVLMQKLMKANEIPAASNLPMTMLMHDIGKVVLRKFNPKQYKIAMISSRNENKPIHIKEDDIIKVNHALAGGILLEKWQMTDDILYPIVFHHSSNAIPEEYIVETAMVQFVDYIDSMARDVPCSPLSHELMEKAGFEELDLHYWVNYQEQLIRDLEGSEDEAERSERMLESNNYYNCTEIPEVEIESLKESAQAQPSRILKQKPGQNNKPAPNPFLSQPQQKPDDKKKYTPGQIDLADTHIVNLQEMENEVKELLDDSNAKTETDKMRKMSKKFEPTASSVIRNKDKTKSISLPMKDEEEDERMFWEILWEKFLKFLKFLIS